MILTAHQPAYLPWLGYLDKIARADVFIYLDTVQFEKNSFINRNRIKTPQGSQWLTIPVKTKGHLSSTLGETEVDEAQPWRAKHMKSIAANYGRAAHFKSCYPRLEDLIARSSDRLADLCWEHLKFWLSEFGVKTRLVRSSECGSTGAKSDLVLDLCKRFGAARYISGSLGREYLVESDFRAAGISIEYQDYVHPVYPQLWGDFLANMSVVDLWLNCGPASLRFGGAHG